MYLVADQMVLSSLFSARVPSASVLIDMEKKFLVAENLRIVPRTAWNMVGIDKYAVQIVLLCEIITIWSKVTVNLIESVVWYS